MDIPAADPPAPRPERAADTGHPADGPTRVVMLVKNSFEYDARVRKEAVAMLRAGFEVTVVALQVPGVTARCETTEDGLRVRRVSRLYGRLATFAGDSTTTPGITRNRDAAPAGNAPHARTAYAQVLRTTRRSVLTVAGPGLRAANTRVVDRRMEETTVSLAPHVVQAHDLNTLRPALAAARRTGAKLIYDSHELHTARNQAGPRARARQAREEKELIGACDLVVTATGTWSQMLAQRYGVAEPLVLRNIPEAQPPGPDGLPACKDLKARIGLAPDVPLMAYQGSIQRGRGIEETLRSLEHLPQVHLAVIGYGAHRPFLEDLAAQSGLADRVHFTGPIDNRELISWIRSIDVGTCIIQDTSLSYRTSLPNKLFEGLHAGLPVVTSDLPEMGAVIQQTGAGELCRPDDPQDIARAVRLVLADPERYRAAARRAAGEMTWESDVAPLVDAVRRLATP
jgi:glycosyltransferase involved in cell wall biosynthesis